MPTFDVEYKTAATGDEIQSGLFESLSGDLDVVAREFEANNPGAVVTRVVECNESDEDDDDLCPECGDYIDDCVCNLDEEGEDEDEVDEDTYEEEDEL